jgi:hypothetical protein
MGIGRDELVGRGISRDRTSCINRGGMFVGFDIVTSIMFASSVSF